MFAYGGLFAGEWRLDGDFNTTLLRPGDHWTKREK
jgi:hypothetical protein